MSVDARVGWQDRHLCAVFIFGRETLRDDQKVNQR